MHVGAQGEVGEVGAVGGIGADRRGRSTRHVRAGHVGSLSRPASRTAPVVARDNDALPAAQESAVPGDVSPSLPRTLSSMSSRCREKTPWGGLPHHCRVSTPGRPPGLPVRAQSSSMTAGEELVCRYSTRICDEP
ncbi:hypothetical protein BHE74_00039134 [Ensete ventricosum]|nr:hypothetical protein BHE74_00039134 [Ensete ventricosum]